MCMCLYVYIQISRFERIDSSSTTSKFKVLDHGSLVTRGGRPCRPSILILRFDVLHIITFSFPPFHPFRPSACWRFRLSFVLNGKVVLKKSAYSMTHIYIYIYIHTHDCFVEHSVASFYIRKILSYIYIYIHTYIYIYIVKQNTHIHVF